jgi:hypothetical protein
MDTCVNDVTYSCSCVMVYAQYWPTFIFWKFIQNI